MLSIKLISHLKIGQEPTTLGDDGSDTINLVPSAGEKVEYRDSGLLLDIKEYLI